MFRDDNEGVDVLCLMWENPGKKVRRGRVVGVPSFTMIEEKTWNSYFSG